MTNDFVRLINRIRFFNQPPGNNLTILKDDTFLVSYPRSGNTWVRFLLGSYFYGDKFDFLTRENYIPAIMGNTNRDLLKAQRPRILKSHSQYCPKYPKVIYLLRDPRDVMVSLFRWMIKNPTKRRKINSAEFETFAKYFFEGDFKFGRWDNHISQWKINSGKIKNGILFIKYEDLKKETVSELKKILLFLDRGVNDKLILKSIEAASFNRMKKLEEQQQQISKKVLPITGKLGFVGEGISDWDNFIKGNIKDSFKKLFGNILIELNYEKNDNW